MVVVFGEQVVYTLCDYFTLHQFKVEISFNLIWKLPKSLLFQWLAYNRIGTFETSNEMIRFVPGHARVHTYFPVCESLPLFSLAWYFHESNICSHFEAVTSLMDQRKTFRQYWIDQPYNSNHEVSSTVKFNAILTKVNFSCKRKRKASVKTGAIDTYFLRYLRSSGISEWKLLK